MQRWTDLFLRNASFRLIAFQIKKVLLTISFQKISGDNNSNNDNSTDYKHRSQRNVIVVVITVVELVLVIKLIKLII